MRFIWLSEASSLGNIIWYFLSEIWILSFVFWNLQVLAIFQDNSATRTFFLKDLKKKKILRWKKYYCFCYPWVKSLEILNIFFFFCLLPKKKKKKYSLFFCSKSGTAASKPTLAWSPKLQLRQLRSRSPAFWAEEKRIFFLLLLLYENRTKNILLAYKQKSHFWSKRKENIFSFSSLGEGRRRKIYLKFLNSRE